MTFPFLSRERDVNHSQFLSWTRKWSEAKPTGLLSFISSHLVSSLSDTIRQCVGRPHPIVAPLVGLHLLGQRIDSHHAQIALQRPPLAQAPLLGAIQHRVRVQHGGPGLGVAQHVLHSVDHHQHDVIVDRSLEEPVTGMNIFNFRLISKKLFQNKGRSDRKGI